MAFSRSSIAPLGMALSGLLVSTTAGAAKLVDGSFLATRECPAYVSKFQRTNPDDAKLVPGRIYPLFEINQDIAPDYYRIRLEGANPVERWVAANCGEYPPKSSPSAFRPGAPEPGPASRQCAPPPPHADVCRTCGKADAYVLALLWQPGFCETQRKHLDNHPECRNPDPGGHSARNFSLRGLWPTQRKCKHEYGYCGTVAHEMQPFSAYPPVNLSDTRRQALEQAMAANSGQERHDWHKYGTCTGFSEDAYFDLGVDLARQFNQSGMANFLAGNLGQKIRREEFFQQIETALGAGARKHINIECNSDGKTLTGVNVNLPANIMPGAELKSLIQQAPRAGAAGNCGSRIVIDAVGFE